jgi:hypothetical protein
MLPAPCSLCSALACMQQPPGSTSEFTATGCGAVPTSSSCGCACLGQPLLDLRAPGPLLCLQVPEFPIYLNATEGEPDLPDCSLAQPASPAPPPAITPSPPPIVDPASPAPSPAITPPSPPTVDPQPPEPSPGGSSVAAIAGGVAGGVSCLGGPAHDYCQRTSPACGCVADKAGC